MKLTDFLILFSIIFSLLLFSFTNDEIRTYGIYFWIWIFLGFGFRFIYNQIEIINYNHLYIINNCFDNGVNFGKIYFSYNSFL